MVFCVKFEDKPNSLNKSLKKKDFIQQGNMKYMVYKSVLNIPCSFFSDT